MDRREFISAAAVLAVTPSIDSKTTAVDLVLRNATIVDGTGARRYEADVAIGDGTIRAIGRKLTMRGAEELNLHGLALAPGFIDIHSHTDRSLLVNANAESKVRQGVTTEVVGQDGDSMGPWSDAQYEPVRADVPFRDLAGFFRWLDENGAAVNVASMVGQGTIRGNVIGESGRAATPTDVARMQDLVREALQQGACGLSTGLEYTPGAFATTAEIAALAEPLRGTGLPYASHLRNEDDRLFGAVEEALHIGRRAGIPVEISHIKAQGSRNWWKDAPLLQTLEAANRAGAHAAFDVYPYVAYMTTLSNLFPTSAREGGTDAFLARLQDPATKDALETAAREKVALLGSWDSFQVASTGSKDLSWAEGRRLGELAKERGEDPYALAVRLIREDRENTSVVGFGMSEENIERQLAHPLAAICSDAEARAPYGKLSEGKPHPRTYGAFPRVLGHYVRKGALSLEQAVQKMTSIPAARVHLFDRGKIAIGLRADLVVFDPATVADKATFESPHQYPVGIPHVIVGGRFVVRDGEHTNARPGRSARPRSA